MDIRTLYLVVGIVYLVVPFTLYLAIRAGSDRQTLVWNLAWLTMGLGAVLVGLRGTVPDWMSYFLAHLGFAVAYLCRAAVLMMERDLPAYVVQESLLKRYGLVAVGYLAIFGTMVALDVPPAYRMIFVHMAHLYFFLEFAVQAVRVSRTTGRSGALLLAVMGLMIGFGFLVRASGILADIDGRQDTFYPSVDHSVILLLALIGFVIGHFGFFQLRVERLAVQKQRVMDQLLDAEQINRQLQRVLAERNDHLKRVSVMNNASGLGMLAGSLTHELSQPLTSIRLNLGFVEKVMPRLPGFEAAHDALREVTSESERLYGVVTRLRSLFQKGASAHEPIVLSALVASVVSIVESHCQEEQINLHRNLDDRIVILGDRVQMQSLLLNLINNAIEAIQGTHKDGNIWLSVRQEEDRAVISVRDDGPGFPSHFSSQDPQVFFSSKSDGSGFGLWLCRLVAEGHGGTLTWSQGLTPHGALVEVAFPLFDPTRSSTPEQS
jgi:signal transduction histidine kinase